MTGPGTAPRSASSSGLLMLFGVTVVATMLFVAFAGQDDTEIGGFADADGTGREGLLALRLLAEESGGTFDPTVSFPGPEHDVVFLPAPLYDDFLAEFDGSEDNTEENHQPILKWVDTGGVLITAVDVPEAPQGAVAFQDDERAIERGVCSIDVLTDVTTLRVLSHTPIESRAGDETCFPTDQGFTVVARERGRGIIYRVATPELFFNRSLDDEDNAAFTARLMSLGAGRNIGLLTGPEATGFGDGVPLDDDGNPIGLGDDNLIDLVPDNVWAMLLGLAGAALIYALARGHRLGSPVEETLPIELPSSHYVEAVGRLYRAVEDPRGTTADVLRTDFRAVSSRKVGLNAATSSADLSRALAISSDLEAAELVNLLDGPTPSDDDALVALAADLAQQRSRLTGVHSVTERHAHD